MPSPADHAFLRFQATGRPEALAEVFDLTAAELLRVAAHLAPDAHAAEDLVQETFLAAIESRGAFTAGHDVGAWLLGILRHRAQRRWRAHTRSVDGNDARLGPRPRAADPAAEVEAIELTAEVDAAIQTLPETYRLALRLHLRHGLTPTEIALAHDRPAGSVRTQLARGLALLRARLPRGLAIGALVIACAPRGLAAMRESVVRAAAQAILAPASLGVGTSALALTMKKIVLSAAAAAIVILAGAWQLGAFASRAFPPTVEQAVSLRADLTPASVFATGDEATPAPPAPAREIVAAPGYTGRQYGTLLVRVRWKDDGTPAACVTVVLLDETRANAFLTSRAGVTGADGTVRIERVPAGEITAVTNDEARPRVTVPADGEASVEVLEPRWGQVHGTVVDDAGAPVAGATVIRSDRLHYTRAHEVAITGADGRFAVPLGRNQYVGARKAGWLDSCASVRPTKGETIEVVLRLRGPAGAVAGVVLDARGTPVHGALVTAGWGGGATVLPDGQMVVTVPPQLVSTGSDGAFRLHSVPAGKTTLVARAPDFGLAYRGLEVVIGQTTEIAITLKDGAIVVGHVVDERGETVAGALVATNPQGLNFLQLENQTTTAADGSFRLDSLWGGAVEIHATREHAGRASTKLDLAAGGTTRWEATLVASPFLRGRVIDATGAPMDSALVQVASLDLAQRRTAKATTAADGSFTIECERAEPMSLRVSVRRGTLPSVELDEVAPGGAPITVTVPAATLPSAHVRGVLVAPDGAPATGAFVVLGRGAYDNGTGVPDPATGAFTMGPFPPGEYFAFVQAREGPNVILGSIRLEAGATHDAGRIVVGESGSLKAHVTGANGQRSSSGWLEVLTFTGRQVAGVPVQDGAAHLARVAPGDYLVRVQGDRSQDRALQRATIRKDQETELNLRLFVEPTRTVTVREVPRPHRDPVRQVEIDVFDAAGVLVDRAANGRMDGDAWIVRIVAPPDGRGALVVKGDNVERARLPISSDGPIDVTLR